MKKLFLLPILLLILSLLVGIFLNFQLTSKIIKIVEPFKKPEVEFLIIEDKNCKECFNITLLYNAIKSNSNGAFIIKGEKFGNYKNYLNLIKDLKIEKVPAIIVSGQVENLTDFFSRIPGYKKVKDKIIIESYAPFLSLSDNKVYGIVNIIYLVPKNCTNCYDVTIHKRILENSFLVKIGNERTIYIDEEGGKELIKKYNITAVPTILLSKDISYYNLLADVWKQVGSIENDGTYIFRDENWMQQNGGYVKV